MLNRRSLRIKAMQALYAFKLAEKSDYQLALDHIADIFSVNLNSMQVQDATKLEGNRRLATVLFQESYQQPTPVLADEVASPEVLVTVANAIDAYHRQIKKDGQFYAKTMLAEVEKIYDRYLLILLVLVELANLVKEEEDNRKNKYQKAYTPSPGDLKLHNNRLIGSLRKHQGLESEVIRRGLNWNKERSLLRQVYRNALKSDPVYLEYTKTATSSLVEDRQLVNHLWKSLIFKQELLQNYFEEADLNWVENGEIIKSMLSKTMKTVEKEGDEIELLTLSMNWEDDKEFFIQLYQHTLENDEQYEQLIVEKVKNWDPERVATVDKILLKMAISEMVSFPSIPVKVTINEYIELSKLYSTPKSRQFVNGVLDVIAIDLVNTGTIRKSGRGLIDNK